MKIFSIYTSKVDSNHIIAIQDKFCFSGLILGVLWAAYNKIWSLTIISILISMISYHLDNIAEGSLSFFLESSLILSYGLFGQELLAYQTSKNFEFKDVVIAYSKEEAEFKYRNSIFQKEKANVCTI